MSIVDRLVGVLITGLLNKLFPSSFHTANVHDMAAYMEKSVGPFFVELEAGIERCVTFTGGSEAPRCDPALTLTLTLTLVG